ncbi:biopolymer transporter ExbB [Aliigemmobacter aestuarii]|uniref:Biopolymer transporter ExbB n=1 Tax=Aliigemmobacter aestuarii TaxID=1445661 RepID=A0A4S3MTX9_9RHOB|nr:biopolymer transporter ExbB [Gemmobacter aestuarii]THD84971.1 biopolymer transporter ExbB [Gemmobacter aestuarii]
MDKSRAAVKPVFTQPIRQITLMLIVIGLFIAGAWVAYPMVSGVFWANPMLNGFIGFVFVIGILSCIWQVVQLVQSVSWIEAFVQARAEQGHAPRLLAPLAALLRARGAEMQISASSARSILDSVATRIDEARDITRYLANLLIFLGLLGTFYGLATTVPAVVETIRALKPEEGQSGLEVFDKLMSGLEAQLGGMGTAFSSSLLGLVGSLVVGLLELFAGHGQNRFYRELEEWLSSFTRLGFAGADGDGAGEGEAGTVVQVLDHLTRQLDALHQMQAETDTRRALLDERIAEMVQSVGRLTDRMAEGEGQSAALLPALERIAEGQERVIAALGGGEGGGDAESRMRLRSIDVQLLRILEEISAGRQESVADLRADLTALTAAVRQLSRVATGRTGG